MRLFLTALLVAALPLSGCENAEGVVAAAELLNESGSAEHPEWAPLYPGSTLALADTDQMGLMKGDQDPTQTNIVMATSSSTTADSVDQVRDFYLGKLKAARMEPKIEIIEGNTVISAGEVDKASAKITLSNDGRETRVTLATTVSA